MCSKKLAQIKNANMRPEEKLARSERIKRRFRYLIRFVIENLHWLQDTTEIGLSTSLHKNLAILRRRKTADGDQFTLFEKTILNTAPEYRTKEEKEHLWKIIDSLRCFRRYPENVKQQLTECSGFAYFPPDRLLIREGEKVAHAMYVVITGSVKVTRTVVDRITNENVVQELGNLSKGYTFGEVALLHQIPRTASIRTNTDCEFIVVTKENFDRVLKTSVKALWGEIQEAMKKYEFFSTWNDVLIRECCILSNLRPYSPGTIIIGDGHGSEYYTYFLTEGYCELIEGFNIATDYSDIRYPKYRMVTLDERVNYESRKCISGATVINERFSVDEMDTLNEQATNIQNKSKQKPKKMTIKRHYYQLCLLRPGHCFNIGENIKNRRVLAKTNVLIMCIPKYLLMSENYDNRWTHHQVFLDSRIPSTKVLLRRFIEDQKWKKYKQTLLNDILQKRNGVLKTSVHDIPYSIRIKDFLK